MDCLLLLPIGSATDGERVTDMIQSIQKYLGFEEEQQCSKLLLFADQALWYRYV